MLQNAGFSSTQLQVAPFHISSLNLQFRAGLNLGDVIVEGDNLFGDGVNVAARLEPLAKPGGICISGKFYEEVHRKLELIFENVGPREVKNIDNPVQTYDVILDQDGETSSLKKSDSVNENRKAEANSIL